MAHLLHIFEQSFHCRIGFLQMIAAMPSHSLSMARDHSGAGLAAWLQSGVIAAGYVIFSTTIIKIFLGSGTAIDPPRVKLVFLSFYAIIACMIMNRPIPFWHGMCRVPLLAVLLLLPVLSTAWSIVPGATLVRSVALMGSSLFGIYLALYVEPVRLLRILAGTSVFTALLCLAMIVAVPAIGIEQTGPWAGTWVGVHAHKNGFGAATALGGILALVMLKLDGWRSPLWLGSLLLHAILLAGSKSLTSQLMFVASAFAVLLMPVMFRHVVRQWVLSALIILPPLLAVLIFVSSDDIAALLKSLGKDPSMSARLPIWEFLVPYINHAFWLGYGYEAFWEPSNWPVRIIEFRLHFRPSYAHNGVLELWLNLGLLGVALFGALITRYLWVAARAVQINHAYIPLAFTWGFIAIFLITNFSESTILWRNSIHWLLFIVTYIWLSDRRLITASATKS